MSQSSLASPFVLMWKWGSFVRFSHTLFALPFAIAAMALAARDQRGWPGWRVFGLILAAMVCARTCAMAFNRIADRHSDALNPRTAGRHLPRGEMRLASAWALCISSGLGLVVVCYFINPLCFHLSPVALAVVCFYSLTKRFSDFSHFFLGGALALAPIGAWMAVTGSFDLFPIRGSGFSMRHSAILPLVMGVAVVFWLVGLDMIYSVQDYEFDRTHGLHSLVVRWGVQNALSASFLAHLCMWVTLGVFGLLCRFRVAYLVGLAVILACLVLEHWLARKRDLKWVNTAFFRLNALVSVVFMVVTIAEVAFPAFRLVW